MQWTADDYRWRVKLPGTGHGSPTLWGEKIFVMSADPDTATRYVLCIDAADGSTRWTRSFESAAHPMHAFNSYADCTPAVDEDRIYLAWATPRQITFIALDHAGETVWQRDLGPFVSMHGFGISPMVYEDTVILPVHQQALKLQAGEQPGKSFVIAVDRKTGQTVWRSERRSTLATYSMPCVYQPPDGPPELILVSTSHGIDSLDPRTGRRNWAIPVITKRTVGSPLLACGLVFGSTGSGGGGNYAVAVRPGREPQEAYRVDRAAPYVPTMVARGDLVFLFGDRGIATCIEGRTGEVVWRHRVGGDFFSSPVRVGEKIYGVDSGGTVVVVAAERQFRLLGKTSLGEPTRATPAVAGDCMYLRTVSHLMALGGQ